MCGFVRICWYKLSVYVWTSMWYVLMARYLGPCYQAPCHRLQKSGEGMVHSRVDHSHVPGILDCQISTLTVWQLTAQILCLDLRPWPFYILCIYGRVYQKWSRTDLIWTYIMECIYPVYSIVMIKFVKPVDSCKVFMNPSCCFCMALSGGWSFQLFLLKLLVWCVCCKFQDIFVIYVALPQV